MNAKEIAEKLLEHPDAHVKYVWEVQYDSETNTFIICD